MKHRLNALCLALIKHYYSVNRVLIYIFVLLLTQSTLTWAQNNSVDSLQRQLKTNLPDSTRIDVFLKLANSFNKDKARKVEFYEEALQGASEIKDQKRLHQVIIDYTQWLRENSDQSDSIEHIYNRGLKSLTIPKYLLSIYYMQGEFYFGQGKDEAAKNSINKGIELAKKNNFSWDVARGFVVLGNGQFYKLEYEKAFSLYARADSVCDASEKLRVSPIRAKIQNYMGYAVRITHGYDKAVEYYFKAKEIYQELNDLSGVQEVNLGLTQYYTNKGEYEKAEQLLTQAVTYYRDRGPQSSYTYAIISRGYFFLKQKMYDKALKDYQLYHDIAFEGTNKLFQLNALNYMSYLYLEMGKLKLASQFGEDGIKLSKEIGELETRKKIYEQLVLIYTKDEATEKLNHTYKNYIALRDELDSLGKDKEIFELEAKYQTEKKEQEIALLTTQNQLARQEKQNQLYLLLGIVLIVVIVAVFFFILYRNRQKTANKLKELDKMKSHFFANVSHEFRTPLTLIKSPVEKELSKPKLDPELKSELKTINRNADRLLVLVDQLLDLSKLESGHMQLQVTRANLLSDLRAIASAFEYLAQQKSVKYTVQIPTLDELLWYDQDVIEKITVNLLSNAFKYTEEAGEVVIHVEADSQQLELSVKNTGEGIDNDEINKVIERFYQTDTSREGAGIGLALVNELISLHKGQFAYTSTEDGWTIFTVRLPVNKESFSNNECVLHESKESTQAKFSGFLPKVAEKQTIDNHEDLNADHPILLVIDDNTDIRTLIKSLFCEDYQIIEAKNGREGIESAIQNIPDVIISDVMMPEVDGVELSATLKQDERTSHIPIILLTAKAGDVNKMIGLETGADDYVIKPFRNEVLQVRVKKLVELRAQLRKRYSQELILKPKEVAVTSADEKFMYRVQELLDDKLTDSDFNAQVFSEEIGMSRMQLHRKLKALVGQTTSELIRYQRLQLAAQMLKSQGINMSEVGYVVGFNDPSYFSKCFKEHFGKSPSAYAEGNSSL